MSIIYKCNGCLKKYYDHVNEKIILGGEAFCSMKCFDVLSRMTPIQSVNVNGKIIHNLPNGIISNGMISKIPPGLYPPGYSPINKDL